MTGPDSDPLRADLEWPDPSKPNRGYSQPAAPRAPAGYPSVAPPPASAGMPYGPPAPIVPEPVPVPRRSHAAVWLVLLALVIAVSVAAWAIWF